MPSFVARLAQGAPMKKPRKPATAHARATPSATPA